MFYILDHYQSSASFVFTCVNFMYKKIYYSYFLATSPHGKFEHFPDLSRVNTNDDIATTKSAPNFPSTTTARTTPFGNSAAAASINIIETSTVAQRLDAIRNNIDFLERSLELIRNNNDEVNNALDESFTQE